MRFGIPLMLLISAALHLAMVAGYEWSAVLSHRAAPESSNRKESLSLVLIKTAPTPTRSFPARQPSLKNIPPEIASTLPIPKKSFALATVSTASRETESRPAPHARSIPEAILSPSPAPPLNGREGVVFILDISGSMYESYGDTTRLALARQTLAQNLGGLVDGTPFAVVLYGDRTHTSGPLVAASNATREAAVRFINEDFDCGGGTDLPAGLAAAQEFQPGRLVVITDGDLNMQPQRLLPQVEEILSKGSPPPSLNLIGISPRSHTEDNQLLQALADQAGGTYQVEKNPPHLLTADAAKL